MVIDIREAFFEYQKIFRPRRPKAWVEIIKGDPCSYCGRHTHGLNWTREHVIPAVRGGPDSWDNIVSSCKFCNHARGNKPLVRWLIEAPRPVRRQWDSWAAPWLAEEVVRCKQQETK